MNRFRLFLRNAVPALTTALVLGAMTLQGCSEDSGTTPVPTTGTIKGVVSNSTSGAALAGATLLTAPSTHTVISGANGTFSLTNVQPSSYELLAYKAGYLPGKQAVSVQAGKTSEVFLPLIYDGKDYTLNFNGEDDHIVVTNDSTMNLSAGSFTIEFFVNSTYFNQQKKDGQNDRWNCVACRGLNNDNLDYLVGFENGRPFFYVRSYASGGTSTVELDEGKWYHVAYVQDTQLQKLLIYVDGTLASSFPLSGTPANYPGNVYIGAREFLGSGKGSHFFNGILYQLRMWNTARTQEQLSASMHTPFTGQENGMVGYWPMNEGTAITGQNRSNSTQGYTIAGNPQWSRNSTPLSQ